MERPHPDLPYPDPSPADKSFAESERNVKTSQGFAEDLPGDKRSQYGPAKEGGLEGQAGVSTAHSTQACCYYYGSSLLFTLIIFTQIVFGTHWPLIGQLFIECAYDMPGTVLGTQQ